MPGKVDLATSPVRNQTRRTFSRLLASSYHHLFPEKVLTKMKRLGVTLRSSAHHTLAHWLIAGKWKLESNYVIVDKSHVFPLRSESILARSRKQTDRRMHSQSWNSGYTHTVSYEAIQPRSCWRSSPFLQNEPVMDKSLRSAIPKVSHLLLLPPWMRQWNVAFGGLESVLFGEIEKMIRQNTHGSIFHWPSLISES